MADITIREKKTANLTRFTANGEYVVTLTLPETDGEPLTFSRLRELLSNAVVCVAAMGGGLAFTVRELARVESSAGGERIVNATAIRGKQSVSVALDSD